MNRTRSRRRDAGMTLVELMVAVVVAGLVIAAVFEVLVTGSSVFTSQSSVAEAQMAGRFGASVVAQDLQNAGFGTSSCQTDPYIPAFDKASSCTAFADTDGPAPSAVQAVWLVNFGTDWTTLGAAGDHNHQFRPDELWIMVNPLPGQRLKVASVDGASGTLTIDGNGGLDTASAEAILEESWVLLVQQRGAHSLRAGLANPDRETGVDAAFAEGKWTVTLKPSPASGVDVHDLMRGYSGADTTVSAVRWVRYRLVPLASTSPKVDLVREEWQSPRATAAASTAVIADDVVDFRVSFCLDTSYNPLNPPVAPTVTCGVDSATTVNANAGQVRAATIVVRTRTKAEDPKAFADDNSRLTWYDLDGNTNNGVARVRTVVKSVSLPALGR